MATKAQTPSDAASPGAKAVEAKGAQDDPKVAAPGGAPPRLKSALETAGLVIAPITLLSALLYYFGWIRSNSLWLYFGIDQSTLGFSNQDYVLRSIGAIFIPLGGLLIFALLLMEGHTELMHWLNRTQTRSRLVVVASSIACLGIVLFGAGLAGEAGHPIFGMQRILTPLAFALGVAALGYATHLRKRLRALQPHQSSFRTAEGSRRFAFFQLVIVGGLITLSIFWALGDWADAAGRGRAQQLAMQIPRLPGVVIYSKDRLEIEMPGIRVEEIGDAQSAYRFRYSGLKLLIRAGGKYFLVPSTWAQTDPVTVVLPDTDARLMEFTPQ